MQRYPLLEQYNPYSHYPNSIAIFPGKEDKLVKTFDQNISYRVVVYEYKCIIPFSVTMTGHKGDTIWTTEYGCTPTHYDFTPKQTEDITIAIRLDSIDLSVKKKKGYDIVVLIGTK
ncbi:MAG: hypothetical protein CVU05_00255 [Bacteroidetes bacterium HGW-Bacteroidetes-21]|jgi:hypothetical protein|nr:MAG: hypothetical protein CVU05_00255 [Bacteroidetes bacterium HGW-Bacteroidetes-21]